jgi:xylulokinase
MMAALELDSSIFPECFESSVVSAKTPDGIPVVGGGGDQAAGAVGTGAVRPGVISVSLGTSGVVFTAIEAPKYDPKGAAHTFCHANGQWHAMGVMLSCGGALRWYRDTFLPDASYDSIAERAANAPIGAGGVSFLPYLTGERCPHNDPMARAVFAGMTLGTGSEHIARSVFEGIGYGLLDGMTLLRSLGATADEIRVTSGGAKSRFWVQMLSDMFETPCATLESDEGPAFGAAVLAGVGIGVWPDVAAGCDATVRIKEKISPSGADYRGGYAKYRSLYESTRAWNLSGAP